VTPVRPRLPLAILVLLFCAFCAGCGSRVVPDLGAQDATPGTDSGLTGPGDARCPSSPPAAGAACSIEELRCEWGNDPRFTCNARSRCYLGRWEVFDADPTKCPSTPYGLPSGCPSRTVAASGARCSSMGLFCGYPEGLCTCMVVGGPPIPDAGTSAPTWVCATLDPSCPRPRPRIGSPCTIPDLSCDYGVCSMVDGSAFRCDGSVGRWTDGMSMPCGGA
jgi:hypothetical protein